MWLILIIYVRNKHIGGDLYTTYFFCYNISMLMNERRITLRHLRHLDSRVKEFILQPMSLRSSVVLYVFMSKYIKPNNKLLSECRWYIIMMARSRQYRKVYFKGNIENSLSYSLFFYIFETDAILSFYNRNFLLI